MKLVLTEKELKYLEEFLDDGKQWERDLNDPHRTLLEKFLEIKDEMKGDCFYFSTQEQ